MGLSAPASGQITHSLPMTGQWYQNRGPLVDIPANGGPALCGPQNPSAGCINNFRPAGGGIPHVPGMSIMITVGATPNDPARFTVPTQAFAQMLGTQNATVQIVPTVVQLDSSFLLDGPAASAWGPNVDRIFEKNAWSVQGHTGRLGLSFSWCPGVGGNPPCPDPRPAINGNAGPENGRVVYKNTSGTGFGGTMSMLTNTGAESQIWVAAGTTQVPVPTPGGMTVTATFELLGLQPFGGMGTQHPGGGYAVIDLDLLASGPLYLGFMTSMQTSMQTGLNGPMSGLITAMGPTLPPPAVLPADTNVNWGFPWTTGTVMASNIQTNMGAMGTTFITGTGTDNRTQAGAGAITLVAGGTTHRTNAITDFAGFDIVTMTLPEPGAALALGLSLAAIGGLYRLRRRF
jgi:hypothetical protein